MRQLIRTLLLISAVALPVVVFSVAVIVQFNEQQQDSVEARLRQAARSAIHAVDRQLQGQFAALGTLASSPFLDEPDLNGFRSHAERIIERNEHWLGVQLFDRDTGQILVDIVAPGLDGLPVPAIRERLEKARMVGDVLIGGAVNQAGPQVPVFVPLGHAIRTNGGRYLLAAAIRAEAFSQALPAEAIPDSWTAALLDQDFIIIGRTRAPESFIGSRATPSLTDEIRRANENFFFSLNKEGARVYTAFTQSASSGWTSALGVPAQVVEAPLRRSLWAMVGGGIGAFGMAVLLGAVLIRSNARRDKLERLLEAERATERRLSDIAANFPGVIFRRVLEPDGRISYPYLSKGESTFADIFQRLPEGPVTLEDISGMIAPDDRLRWKEAIARSARTLGPYFAEGRFLRTDGSLQWVRSAANARQRSDGAIVWDGVVLDITDRVKAEEELRAALAEKENLLDEKTTLLNEVHHRVKNNLQIMTSLLRMERRQIQDPRAGARLDIVSQRIQVMARLHEQLYASGDLARIDIGDTLRQICQDITHLQERADIELRVEAESVDCDLRIAIPFGLLANELISNSFKHAFPEGRSGIVQVTLRRDAAANAVELVVSDDGIGSSASMADGAQSAGIGMKLVSALVRQIGAEIRFEGTEGTHVTVSIPETPA